MANADPNSRWPIAAVSSGAVEGVDAFRTLGQFHGESPGTTADIKYPITWTWQVSQE